MAGIVPSWDDPDHKGWQETSAKSLQAQWFIWRSGAAFRGPVRNDRIGGPPYPANSLLKTAAVTAPLALSLTRKKTKE